MNVRYSALAVLLLGCKSAQTTDHVDGAIENRESARTEAGAQATAVATSSPPRGWRGSYKSEPGALYIPPEWKDVHWRVKDNDGGIGEGTIAVQVDPTTRRVVGTLDGPLGPATIDGVVAEGKMTGTIVRKDPRDQGFMGTLVGTVADGRSEGTMSVSLAEASAIRHATFAMTPDAAEPPSH
jgi:hypothetical protein